MGKIRNSMVPNTFGKGNEKIITLDNGEEYIVRNTMVPNTFGEGYEQEIVKKDKARSSSNVPWCLFIYGIVGIILLCGVWWLMMACIDIIHPAIIYIGFLASIIIFAPIISKWF